MATALGEVGADPFIGNCACLRRELSGEPDVVNLHLRFDEGRGTCSGPLLLYPRAARQVWSRQTIIGGARVCCIRPDGDAPLALIEEARRAIGLRLRHDELRTVA